jgi:hypothetical protein
MKENKESDKIFRNISDVEMEFSKLNYYVLDKHVLKWPRYILW